MTKRDERDYVMKGITSGRGLGYDKKGISHEGDKAKRDEGDYVMKGITSGRRLCYDKKGISHGGDMTNRDEGDYVMKGIMSRRGYDKKGIMRNGMKYEGV